MPKIITRYEVGKAHPQNRALYRAILLAVRIEARKLGYRGSWAEMALKGAEMGIPVTGESIKGFFTGKYWGMMTLDLLGAIMRGYGLPLELLFAESLRESVRDEIEKPTLLIPSELLAPRPAALRKKVRKAALFSPSICEGVEGELLKPTTSLKEV